MKLHTDKNHIFKERDIFLRILNGLLASQRRKVSLRTETAKDFICITKTVPILERTADWIMEFTSHRGQSMWLRYDDYVVIVELIIPEIPEGYIICDINYSPGTHSPFGTAAGMFAAVKHGGYDISISCNPEWTPTIIRPNI